jgi:hypothetical protein
VRLAVRSVLAAVPLLALLWLAWQDFAPRGERVAASDLKHMNPYVSPFYPEGRVSAPTAAADAWAQQVHREPVYFNVRWPRAMAEGEVRLTYRAQNLPSLRIGPRVGGEQTWRFDLQPLTDVAVANSAGWRTGEAVFSLSGATPERGALRFIISAPGLGAPGTSLEVTRLQVRLRAPHRTAADVPRLLLSRLERLWHDVW